MKRTVVQLDLRGKHGEEALLCVRALLTDAAQPDLTLLLVIEDAAAMAKHQRAYETLLPSRYIEHVLCLAIGRAAEEGGRIALPGSLSQAACVLWVPDTAGINWRLSGTAPARRRDAAQPPDAGLRELLDVLTLPEVFVRAHELIRRLPESVANPGVRLAGGERGQSDGLLAVLAAGERLLEPGTGSASLPELPHSGRRAPGRPVPLRGPLGTAVEEARIAVAEASGLADELGAAASLFGPPLPIEEATGTAGESLARLRARMEGLLTRAHSTVGLDQVQRETIEREGVVLPELETFDAVRARKAIDAYLTTGLDQGMTLPQLIDGLDRSQAALKPTGSREHIPALHRACTDELLERLRQPVPMPGPQPWLCAAGAAAGGLAGLTPLGPVSGLIMALLWTMLVALTVQRGPGGRLAEHATAVGVNAVAAVAGGMVGGLAVTPPLPPFVWTLALAAGLALAGWSIRTSWHLRAERWTVESGLRATADQAIEGLVSILSKAVAEWSRAGARIDAADAVTRMSVALVYVGAKLGERAGQAAGGRPRAARSDPRIRHHLADLVREALAPRLRALDDGSPAEHGERAGRRTAELLDEWAEHIGEHGGLVPPPFARRRDAAAPRPATEEVAELAEAAASDPHAVMWQLCGADDLPALDSSAGQAGVVRFAPQLSRPVVEGRLPAETVWVASGEHAGVLRLVPVRPGVLAKSWGVEPEVTR